MECAKHWTRRGTALHNGHRLSSGTHAGDGLHIQRTQFWRCPAFETQLATEPAARASNAPCQRIPRGALAVVGFLGSRLLWTGSWSQADEGGRRGRPTAARQDKDPEGSLSTVDSLSVWPITFFDASAMRAVGQGRAEAASGLACQHHLKFRTEGGRAKL